MNKPIMKPSFFFAFPQEHTVICCPSLCLSDGNTKSSSKLQFNFLDIRIKARFARFYSANGIKEGKLIGQNQQNNSDMLLSKW